MPVAVLARVDFDKLNASDWLLASGQLASNSAAVERNFKKPVAAPMSRFTLVSSCLVSLLFAASLRALLEDFSISAGGAVHCFSLDDAFLQVIVKCRTLRVLIRSQVGGQRRAGGTWCAALNVQAPLVWRITTMFS